MSAYLDKMESMANKVCREGATESEISDSWKEFFRFYLTEIGFNNCAIDKLFSWGSFGHNWELLHIEKSDEFCNMSKKELKERFISEVMYIYDRMCLDRLFRTHWMYNQWKLKK